ncbi:septum formation initiator family protein [bacterium]|nr:MAG: septum formation initiator family protein [bacterium]
MDNLFYRKQKPRFDAKAIAKKLLKNKKLMFALALALPLGAYLIFGNRGILQRVRLQQQKSELEVKIRQAEEETKSLQSQSKALDGDKKAIEKVARERYGMVREGEKVYKVNKGQ